jgi:large subunit ribosomal protein L32e
MADDTPPSSPTTAESPPARPKTRARPRKEPAADTPKTPAKSAADDEKPKRKAKEPEKKAPKRADLSAENKVLLRVRRGIDVRRPVFGRQAANRYYRIGRDGSWRRPRGLQSKQRRHYGYRAKIVRIGYGSPARVRGLVPSGFRPVIVHHASELEQMNPKLDAAIIARTVGTRRRLGLEDAARKLGIHVLNPIETPGEE